MSIRSLFGRKDKGSSSTSPSLPQLPSVREMINDMENIKKNDPILSLAAIIEKKGRQTVVDSDIKELMEALRQRRKSDEQTAASTSLPSFRRQSLRVPSIGIEKRAPTSVGGGSGADPKSKVQGNEGKKVSTTKATNVAEKTMNYDKLKHFLTTCEHSQELISTLEPEFKKLETEMVEYSKCFDVEIASHSADSESESKLT